MKICTNKKNYNITICTAVKDNSKKYMQIRFLIRLSKQMFHQFIPIIKLFHLARVISFKAALCYRTGVIQIPIIIYKHQYQKSTRNY